MSAYLKAYCKEVKPRYKTDYKEKPCIITKDKALVDIIRRNYKGRYTISKTDDKAFVIWLEEEI